MRGRGRFFGVPDPLWLLAALTAAALLLASIFFPLWRMELVAPQYPRGLVMYAYGYKFESSNASPYDDIREINILNHYIGMRPIEEVTEMRLFLPGVSALALGTVVGSFIAWRRRWIRALLIAGYWTVPLFFVVDLQYWLYKYGHTMDPDAPLNTGAFTPKVYGATKVWNFHTENTFEPGFYLMVVAALVITLLPPFVRWVQAGAVPREKKAAPERRGSTAASSTRSAARSVLESGPVIKAIAVGLTAGALALAAATGPAAIEASGGSLQERIDAAAPGTEVVVRGGVFKERIVIDKPLTLVGRDGPVIDGGGQGTVVTVTASDVYFTGFTVRNAGRAVTREPAAIKVTDAERVTLRLNRFLDSHFGVYLVNSHEVLVEANLIDLGAAAPIQRRGHGVYMWKTHHSAVRGNEVRNAADGIHLEFSDSNVVADNVVTDSRYGLHYMYANQNKVLRNDLRHNLSGAVLMFSREIIVQNNNLSDNRKGATGAGMLLKDVDNIFAERNTLLRNKYGMTAEGTPQAAGASAIFYANVFALNDTGIGLMSNAPIVFVGNSMIENTVQVRALGGAIASRLLEGHAGAAAPATGAAGQEGHEGHGATATTPPTAAALPKGAVWMADGRGNYWSDYRGYDANSDGVGDKPYLPLPPFAGRLASNDNLRVFNFTLAQQAIDAAARMFPVYRHQAVIEDAAPLMQPPVAFTTPAASGPNGGLALFAAGLLAAVSAVLFGQKALAGSAAKAKGAVASAGAGRGRST